MTDATRLEVFTVIKDGDDFYYLLKVVRRGFDVYCIPPHLGLHYSVHESGKAHFTFDQKEEELGNSTSVILISGEAGTPNGDGVIRVPLSDLGRAAGICTAIYPVDSLSTDFEVFARSTRECFVIDKKLLGKEGNSVEIGVWAVPTRNEVSFEFNVLNVPETLLHKIAHVEPQIWIYAKPFGD